MTDSADSNFDKEVLSDRVSDSDLMCEPQRVLPCHGIVRKLRVVGRAATSLYDRAAVTDDPAVISRPVLGGFLFVACLCLCATMGCGDASQANGSDGSGSVESTATEGANARVDEENHSKDAVAVLFHRGQGPRAAAIRAGANREADQRKLTLDWIEVDSDDVDGQAKQLERAIREGYAAICLCPLETERFVEAVEQAEEKGIKVVLFDLPLTENSPADPNRYTYATVDHFYSGQLIAELAAKEMKEKGAVLVLASDDSTSNADRKLGVTFALKNFGTIETREVSERSEGDTSHSVSESLTKFATDVESQNLGIVALDGDVLRVAMQWAKSNQVDGRKVRVYGFGADGHTVEAIKSEQLAGTILEDPHMLGVSTIMTVADLLEGKGNVGGLITSGGHLATLENIDEPPIRELLQVYTDSP